MKRLIIGAVALVGLGYLGAKFYVNYKTAEAVDQFVAAVAPFAQIEYDSVSSSMGGALAVNQVSIRFSGYKDALDIASVGIQLPSFLDLLRLQKIGPTSLMRGEIPKRMQLFMNGILFDTGNDYIQKMFRDIEAQTVAEFGGEIPSREADPLGHCTNRFGVSSLDLLEMDLDRMLMSVSYGYQELSEEVSVTATWDVEDVYEFDADIRFRGNLRDAFNANRALLTGFEISGQDLSATERALKRCEALGVDRETAKAASVTAFLSDLDQAGFTADDRLAEPLRAGVLAEHRNFRVIGDPPQPVNLGRIGLYKSSDMPALLGVDVQTW